MKPSEFIKNNTDMFSIGEGIEVNNNYLKEFDKRFIDKAEVEKIIDKMGGIKCGFMDRDTCDRIDKKELKQKLKGEKK